MTTKVKKHRITYLLVGRATTVLVFTADPDKVTKRGTRSVVTEVTSLVNVMRMDLTQFQATDIERYFNAIATMHWRRLKIEAAKEAVFDARGIEVEVGGDNVTRRLRRSVIKFTTY
jgi:phosphoenolpyruvate carboxylase